MDPRARAHDAAAFQELAEAHRRELHLHCYRLLGSTQEAEDVVQETLLAAWRGFEQFEGRASTRTWLYRIATNRSLDVLRAARRRGNVLPVDVGDRVADVPATPHRFDAPWLEPYPDSLLEGVEERAQAPDARYEAKEAVSLAFVAALQALSPRQRAVLILRDVLGFRAAEVAAMLETTEPGVNSALLRARAAIEARRRARTPERIRLPQAEAERRLVDRFVQAFQDGEVDDVVALLADEARFAMPPTPLEYRGSEQIAAFLADRFRWRGAARLRLVPTRANGQPAFGCYLQDPAAPVAWAHGLLVLTLDGERISGLTRFLDNAVLERFGLPLTLPEATTAPVWSRV